LVQADILSAQKFSRAIQFAIAASMLSTGPVSRPIDQVFPPAKPSGTEALDTCSDTTASGIASEPSSLPSSPSEVGPTSQCATTVPADLPSIGSLGHYVGQCSRCCFHPKGRCLNGYDCRFCHFDHDKRRRKKTRPVFSSLAQGYGELHSTVENAAAPYTPPGLATYIPEHGNFSTGIVQGNQPAVSYTGSPMPMQPVGLEGFPPSLQYPFAPEHAPLAPPSWPAPSCPPHSSEFQDLQLWSLDKVSEWLVSVGLGHLKEIFQEHRISGDVLMDLTQTDLTEMGVSALGDRKRILRGIALLRLPPMASNLSSPQGSMFL